MQGTLRDYLVDRLRAEFGEPWPIHKNFRWSVASGAGNAPLNILLNSWHTPHDFAVWIFDPRLPGTDPQAVWYMKIDEREKVDPLITKIKHQLAIPRPLARAGDVNKPK